MQESENMLNTNHRWPIWNAVGSRSFAVATAVGLALLLAFATGTLEAASLRSFTISIENRSHYTVDVQARASGSSYLTRRLSPGTSWRPTLTTTSSSNWAQVIARYGTCSRARQGRYKIFTVTNAASGCPIDLNAR
jgi:hypothetical protein